MAERRIARAARGGSAAIDSRYTFTGQFLDFQWIGGFHQTLNIIETLKWQPRSVDHAFQRMLKAGKH